MIGRTLSHYKILDEISRGGMGVVYRAVDTKLNREVAFKVLPEELVADQERKRRFVQEAQAAASLEHPNIAVVYEIDDAEGVTFIVMELIRGDKLSELLKRERLSLARVLDLSTEVAEGLAQAHEKGIVHRDLKPGNIMLTPEGRAKIIDFGLAKLIEPIQSGETEAPTALRRETDPGIVMGTVSYMSPEQARGAKADHRSDVFSFGIVLHELLTGKPPFQGPTGIDTLHAIMRDPPPELAALGPDVTPEAAADLQRILDKCLEKEPSERYQTMKDLAVDLRASRRRLESGAVARQSTSGAQAVPATDTKASRGPLIAGAAAVLVMGIVLGWLLLRPEPPDVERATSPSSSKPSVAVMLFDNINDDPSLDWLRMGLTEMLVTDLSQSPNIDVLSTNRLYQILEDLNRQDDRVTSLEVIQEVAKRADAGTVVVGSFMKAGENIRINIRVQDAGSGKILTTEKSEGVGEDSIFSMVDDLTQRIKTNFDIPAVADAGSDRQLRDVTTSSVEAYRYFVEAEKLNRQGKTEEAILLAQKGVELDPAFASALNDLSIYHWNLGNQKEYEEYAKQALEHVDRVTVSERLFIEATFYTYAEGTFDRGLPILEKVVELFPKEPGNRNDLAVCYGIMERFEEAIEQCENVKRQVGPTLHCTGTLSSGYTALGQVDKGLQAIEDFVRANPSNPDGLEILGSQLIETGELDEALAAFRKAESLDPSNRWIEGGRFNVFILREQWEEAQTSAATMRASRNHEVRASGSFSLAALALFRGQSGRALQLLEEDAAAHPDHRNLRASAYNNAARVRIERGEPALGLPLTEKARLDGEGDLPEWEALYLTGLARAKLGQWDDAEKAADLLRQKTKSLPTEKESRRLHHVKGELALAKGETEKAVEELSRAQAMLTPRGGRWFRALSPHVPIWFSLASAHLAAGNETEAATWFQRIVESTTEHIDWPIPYVRSFYFLGKIYENQGNMPKARENYRRFLDFWKDGDLDRERVDEALSKL